MENYQEWRDEKAKELKDMPDHKQRNQAWENYKKEVGFLDEFKITDPDNWNDTLEMKNLKLFDAIKEGSQIIDEILEHKNLVSENDSVIDDLFFNLSDVMKRVFGKSKMMEVEEKYLQVLFKYWMDRLSFELSHKDSSASNFEKVMILDTHFLTKTHSNRSIVPESMKILCEKYQEHRDYIEHLDLATEDGKSEYLLKVQSMVIDFLNDPILQIKLETELGSLKQILEDMKEKLNRKVTV